MFVRCIGTGSIGNSYALHNNNEVLLLDLGLPKREIVKALNYNISNIVGCVISHEHG